MKKITSLEIVILILAITILGISSCRNVNNKNDYLRKVLANLEKIKSATYFATVSTTYPGDTTVFTTFNMNVTEYFNPADTFLGSSFTTSMQIDNNKMDDYYDGKAFTYVDWNKKTVAIDSFQTNISQFRSITPPFFNLTKSIIKYALEPEDSILMTIENFGDSLLFRLVIYSDQIVVFKGKPYHIDNQYSSGNEISRYDIWINKSDYLPYRYRRSTPRQISLETYKNVEFNKNKLADFIVSKKIPSNFKMKYQGKQEKVKNDLEGRAAPDWILKDFNNNSIGLKDLKSKILLIQFTGIGCVPCHASIPFMKQLVIDNWDKDFDFVGIETWSKNITEIKTYYNKNDLNYKLLISNDSITKYYHVDVVPTFFILDKDRVIRKVIRGYGEGTTDKEIKDALNGLI